MRNMHDKSRNLPDPDIFALDTLAGNLIARRGNRGAHPDDGAAPVCRLRKVRRGPILSKNTPTTP